MKKVLIVDDSETVRDQVSAALTRAGFETIGASDGIVGLEQMQRHDFDLVLLDVLMPRMGGMEFLEHVKAKPETKDIPVLVLTTEVHESLVEQAKKTGAAGWIIKPVRMDLLVEAVARLANGATEV